jgi:HAD superfamily hydrolase (TIGR01509 family)
MYKTLIIDFSRVLLFSNKDVASLNKHHENLSANVKDYRILDHFFVNDELLSFIKQLKGKVQVCLFTDGSLHDVPDIRGCIESAFDVMITAEEMGAKKNSPQTYLRLVEVLDVQPNEVLFVDDKIDNVEAAQKVGVAAVQFKDNKQVVAALHKLLEIN